MFFNRNTLLLLALTNKMRSAELQFLIECCKISLLQVSDNDLMEIIKNREINWEKLQNMLVFHSISPTVYYALKGISSEKIDAGFLSHLNTEVKIKSAHNILLLLELTKLKQLFNKHQIPFIHYKGLAWGQTLYKTAFREGIDMDLLIDKNKLFKALNLLIEDGYEIKQTSEYSKKYQPDELLKLLIETERIELQLTKEQPDYFLFKFDFHWELLPKHQAYGFEISDLSNHRFNEREKLLLMIILHNGKKEVWSKLKYVCDLLLFIHQYNRGFNWDLFLEKLNNPSLEKALLKGLALVNLFLPLKDTITLSKEIPEADALNIRFWEKAWPPELSISSRFQIFRLVFSYHKSLKESYYYLTNYIRYLSYPTPLEPRLFLFPRSYQLLNLSGKVISYLYFHIFKKKN